MAFNLTDRPWIGVLDSDGIHRDLSVRETLIGAPTILRLAGETSSQDVAILRLLLAVCRRATQAVRSLDDQLDDWQRWWDDWTTIADAVEVYLDSHGGFFDLTHPERPFMQVAGLTPQGTLGPGLAKLVPDLDGFFTERAGPAARRLTAAEAARWLVHCQSFDVAGIKTGAAGDPRAKGGKGYPTGFPAWCGNLGLVVLEGRSLAETLLFNFRPSDGDADAAVWERAQGPESSTDRVPAGPTDLLVWPNRRIRLHWSGDDVVNAQVSYGDTLTPYNRQHLETMSAWRLSAAQTKKQGHTVYLPVQHAADRQVWRGLAALLTQGEQVLPNLAWLAEVREAGLLSPDTAVSLHVVGFEHGPQNSSIASVIDDRLDTHLITVTDERLVEIALTAVTDARACVGPLTTLSGRLATVVGGDDTKAKDLAARAAYAALDPVYRRWLAQVVTPDHRADYLGEWHRLVRSELTTLGRRMVDDAGPRAVAGRLVDGQLVDVASIWAAFAHRLAQLTPLAYPTPTTDAEDPDAV